MIAHESIPVTNEILKVIAEIDEFKGIWKATEPMLSPEGLLEKRQGTFAKSAAASIRLRGDAVSDRTITETLKALIPGQTLATQQEKEAAGYADTLQFIHGSQVLSFDEHTISKLHRNMLRYDTRHTDLQGQYKLYPNPIIIKGVEGSPVRSSIQTASPDETPRRMAELTRWMRGQIESGPIHPLLAIAIFLAAFLVIHPFSEGNYRLGHLLAQLLLRKFGYGYMSYGSWERATEQTKEEYFAALRRVQESLKASSPVWEPWFTAFLTPLPRYFATQALKASRDRNSLSARR